LAATHEGARHAGNRERPTQRKNASSSVGKVSTKAQGPVPTVSPNVIGSWQTNHLSRSPLSPPSGYPVSLSHVPRCKQKAYREHAYSRETKQGGSDEAPVSPADQRNDRKRNGGQAGHKG
jgi:hypothetical protein